MKSSFVDLLKSAFGPKDEKFRQKLSIFLVCLVISMIIWFSTKLANNFDTVIEMPVTFSNIPKNKVLTKVSDSVLYVEIVEKGSDLFRMQYVQGIPPATISLKNISLYSKNGVYEGIIIPSAFINDIEHEHNLLGKVISIRPDTIFLTLESQKGKILPVSVTLDVTYDKEFMLYGQPVFEPDSVMVRGPVKTIEKLKEASLGTITLKDIKETLVLEKIFEKDSMHNLLDFTPNIVRVTLPVEKFTGAEVQADVRIINNGSKQVRIFPDNVKVFYKVALKDYSRIEKGMISAVADFSDINFETEDKVRIHLDAYPEFVEITRIEPEKAEFIIIK
jgi:hypothetical protein